MKLKEYLETAPEGRALYLGASVGFFFGGSKQELLKALPALNEKYKEQAETDMANAEKLYKSRLEAFGEDDKATINAKKRMERLTPFIPFEERNIAVDEHGEYLIYERTTEEATNIIVTGDERGKLWSVHEGEDEWKSVKLEYNAEELIGAVLAGVVEDYEHDLYAELEELRAILTKLQEYRTKDASWKKYLRSDTFLPVFGIDPEYVIKKVREKVTEDIRYHAKEKERRRKSAKVH